MSLERRSSSARHLRRTPLPAAPDAGERYEYYDRQGRLIETEAVPGGQQSAGHYAGLHAEDAPYTSRAEVPQSRVYAAPFSPVTRRTTRDVQENTARRAPKTRVLHKSRFHWSLFVGI